VRQGNPNPDLNILIAYPYWKQRVTGRLQKFKEKIPVSLIVDSGAFTAWNTGMKITLDGYLSFLKSVECMRPFHYVQLDVFGDPHKSFDNLLEMHAQGFKDTMPVFTRGESIARLEQFYEMTDYIMFGGIVTGGGNYQYVKWYLNRNKDRDCHWLGFVDMRFIRDYRPRSVDSSSWKAGSRFGVLHWYNGNGNMLSGRWNKIKSTPHLRTSVMDYFTRIGVPPSTVALLGKQKAWRGTNKNPDVLCPLNPDALAQTLSAIAHVHRAYEVEKTLGTKIYLACGGLEWEFAVLNYAWHFLKQNGVIQ